MKDLKEQTPTEASPAATAALERADARELYEHYKDALRKCDKMSAAMTAIASHYIGTTDSPRYTPSENAVESMERVALAAIELAKAVIVDKEKLPP